DAVLLPADCDDRVALHSIETAGLCLPADEPVYRLLRAVARLRHGGCGLLSPAAPAAAASPRALARPCRLGAVLGRLGGGVGGLFVGPAEVRVGNVDG